MKAKNRFEETKIKMVMKLRGLTREAAVKALKLDEGRAGVGATSTKHTVAREERMSAKKLFSGRDGVDGEWISAEDFFSED